MHFYANHVVQVFFCSKEYWGKKKKKTFIGTLSLFLLYLYHRKLATEGIHTFESFHKLKCIYKVVSNVKDQPFSFFLHTWPLLFLLILYQHSETTSVVPPAATPVSGHGGNKRPTAEQRAPHQGPVWCSATTDEELSSLTRELTELPLTAFYSHTLIHPDFSRLLSAYTVLSVARCSEVLNFELPSKPSYSLAKCRSRGSPFTSGLFLALCWLQILHPILRSCLGSTGYLTLTGTKGEIWKVWLLTFFLLTFLMQTKVWTKWQKCQQTNTKH